MALFQSVNYTFIFIGVTYFISIVGIYEAENKSGVGRGTSYVVFLK